jgi:GT2 family glycosyltransferase
VTVTVLLLSVDEAPMLEHSLPAALAQDPVPEVVVVDNASSDRTAELARRQGARHLPLAARVSYATAINRAIATTGGEFVLLLNADCFLRPGFLAAACERMTDPGVGSVAPKLLRVAAPGRPLEQIDAAGMFVDRHRKNGIVGHGRPSGALSVSGAVFGADGAAALYRRRTLEDCSLPDGEVLDEDMELWATDADLAWRARLFGWRSVYEPRALADHVRTYSPSTRPRMSEQARRLQFRNRYLMMVKNETRAGLARDGALIAGYEILALGHVLLRERHLLRGYGEAYRSLPAARRRRRLVQGRRRVELPPFGLEPPD